jgi:hypothetical protein
MSDLLIDGLALIKAWAVGFFVSRQKEICQENFKK